MIKVSVIIPVYNVEPYLKEALDSVINQTLREIEIICIDDCSTDNSYNILEEYAKKDNRIIIIKNEDNMGVGYSRNVGEKLAKGEYIHFMDPDDCISLNFYECMYNTGKKYNSDVVNTNHIYVNNGGNLSPFYTNVFNYKKIYDDYQYNVDFKNLYSLDKKYIISYNLWSKFFKKTFLIEKNLFSTENKIGSAYDADLLCRIILNNPTFSFNNNAKYFYRVRDVSITKKMRDNVINISYVIENSKNTILYCKQNNPKYLYDLYIILWNIVVEIFINSNNSFTIYNKLYEYANELDIKENPNYNEYMEYLLIKTNEDYNKYLLNKMVFNKINILEDRIYNIEKNTNWFRLFGINNSKDCLIIILFGIKISIKKNNKNI
ncbi:glycosyltransferase family 2 protein [Brachyspira pilosicoli]|uniref:glycosyltransferase family 2 protein n=1 Tax=Brachyspira pilosicoli TaxID=52584 RepID=UPI0012F4E8EE|nr:glycosyltransferase family 2 protein [Brachyspira pilosicoli]